MDKELEDTIELNVDDLFTDNLNLDDTNNTNDTNDTNNTLEPTDTKKKEADIITKAVSERINEVKRKTELETKNNIAKDLGYNSYDEMIKSREDKEKKQLLEEAGIDSSKETEELIEKLVEKRLANNPKLKKLEEYENKEKINFVNSQLQEINKLTGGNIKDVSELPQETLALWEKTGNLKQAFLATQGEQLLLKNLSSNKNGTLNHLANPNNNSGTRVRALTAEEKEMYRSIISDISEEELNKKTMPID